MLCLLPTIQPVQGTSAVSAEEFQHQLITSNINHQVIGGDIYLPLHSVDAWMDLIQRNNYVIVGGEAFKKVDNNLRVDLEQLFDFEEWIKELALVNDIPRHISESRQYFKQLIPTHDSVVLTLFK